MADTSNNAMTMFSQTKLIIPDFVSPLDVNKIYEWFEKYNIAKVENVDFYEHEEEEYYAEDGPSFSVFCFGLFFLRVFMLLSIL